MHHDTPPAPRVTARDVWLVLINVLAWLSLKASRREWFAVLCLAGLLIVGGLAPQYNVEARFRAAKTLLENRRQHKLNESTAIPLILPVEPTIAAEVFPLKP